MQSMTDVKGNTENWRKSTDLLQTRVKKAIEKSKDIINKFKILKNSGQ